MDSNHRLHLATRIHFGLLAQLGVAVSVEDLLSASPEGREALWVCEAMDDPALRALALAFTGREPAPAGAEPPTGEVPALHHVVAPRATRWRPASAAPAAPAPVSAALRALPAWAPTALAGEPVGHSDGDNHRADPPAAAGHVQQATAWSEHTTGFGVSRPFLLDDPDEGRRSGHSLPRLGEPDPEPALAPFVPTADALRPSAQPLDISWATELRKRPVPAERPSWKLAFWRKG